MIVGKEATVVDGGASVVDEEATAVDIDVSVVDEDSVAGPAVVLTASP